MPKTGGAAALFIDWVAVAHGPGVYGPRFYGPRVYGGVGVVGPRAVIWR